MDTSIYAFLIEEHEAIEKERNEQILEFGRQEQLKLDLENHLENNSKIGLSKDDSSRLLKYSSDIINDDDCCCCCSSKSKSNEILRITNPILTEEERKQINEKNRINELKAINYYHLLKISNAKINNKKIIDSL
ncbi:hypothetical protein DDB_G0268882 [Dictyostelium discoideum AX4]|uniref:Uncharacterized protein n=1 Tax=Dictyostelium discoideum TaxID=44689 RepID=Q55EI5_DICDI|nr:hypothetical protein DDB_G0268882 [Dictyostelium discoideum AX4]EAL73030.1 hypothetical protein DDB_G0268882 [Dictyostelium discoideum AX4]|eukprot:XP_647035.1 hypothetical protein DDB_G0268882 [Dictyostelium discoideum AX4]